MAFEKTYYAVFDQNNVFWASAKTKKEARKKALAWNDPGEAHLPFKPAIPCSENVHKGGHIYPLRIVDGVLYTEYELKAVKNDSMMSSTLNGEYSLSFDEFQKLGVDRMLYIVYNLLSKK